MSRPGGLAELQARLDLDEKKNPAATLGNAMLVLALDPRLVGMLGFCEFREVALLMRAPPVSNDTDPELPGPYPRPWRRADVAMVTAFIQRNHVSRIGRETVEDAMEAEASRNRFHPVRDWLRALRWDGTPRLHQLLPKGFGTADTGYTRAVGLKIAIAAVRRVRYPGTKFDHVPVAQGRQGAGKSTLWRAFFGDDWFSDDLPDDLGDKDAAMALRGVWGLEMSELTQILQSEPEAIKAFITRAVDRYRPPYGRVVIEVPRQGVLVGTTNAEEWLRDVTGNRRFWPFDCGELDVQWVRANRDQFWAEAAHREAQGEPHWLDEADDRDEAEAQQQERMVSDPWEKKLATYLAETFTRETTAAELLERAIQMAPGQMEHRHSMRVTKILTMWGWRKRHTKRGSVWERPDG